MKTPERFNRAIKALVKGFFNDTLAKNNCSACAVGNIVAESIGEKVVLDNPYAIVMANSAKWQYIFSAVDGYCYRSFHELAANNGHIGKTQSEIQYNEGMQCIERTGYTTDELIKIETAFESNTKIYWHKYPFTQKNEIMQDQFNGLMAVVEVLCKLDNIEPTEYKKAFEYSADFKPVHELAV